MQSLQHNVFAPPKIEICAHTGQNYILENHVDVETSRNMISPFAAGEIQLMGHMINDQPWDEILTLYDLVKISWLSRDGNTYEDGLFLISDIRESFVVSDVSVEERLSISIVSVGKALTDYTIMYHPWLSKRSNVAGLGVLALANGNNLQGNPDEIIQKLFRVFMNDDFQFTFSDGRKIGQVLKLKTEESLNSLGAAVFSNTLGGASLWETMKEFADHPFHEMFVDVPWESKSKVVGEGDEVLYHRPTPYDIRAWSDLYYKEAWGFDFDRSEITGEMVVGPSEDNIKNFFYTAGHNPFTAIDQVALVRSLSGAQMPRYDGSMIRRFGFRKVEHKTLYISFSSSKEFLEKNRLKGGDLIKAKSSTSDSAKKLTDMLVNRTKQQHLWFGYPNYFQGQIPLYGRIGPSRDHGIRIGGILNDKEKKRQYYIKSVTQKWSIGGKHTTLVGVEKGHNLLRRRKWWNLREKEALISVDRPEFQNERGIKFE